MRHKRRRYNEAEISLFPFMAVLICTMGALIVLLVVVVRQVRADVEAADRSPADSPAAAAPAALSAEERAQLEIEAEDHEWRLEMLRSAREEAAEQLRQRRLQLSHIEDHARRLEAELRELLEQDRALARLENADRGDRRALEVQIAELAREVALARQRLAEAAEQMRQQSASYAIVPYDGPHGTRRRPIYIECLADRVVLQPEGIVLTAEDFEEPLGPSNPLASSLRAAREYLHRQALARGNAGWDETGEPYPLLVVRSGGARSYAAAREAIRSWDAEFGYELVGDEVVLAYPPVDPALKAVLQRTVDEARQLRYQMALAAPGRYGRVAARPALRASDRGGFLIEGGGSLADYHARGSSGDGTPAANADAAPGSGMGRAGGSGEGGPGAAAGGQSAEWTPADAHFGPSSGRDPDGGASRRFSGAASDGRQGGPGDPRDANSAAAGSHAAGGVAGGSAGGTAAQGGPAGAAAQGGFGASGEMPGSSLADTRGRDWALPNAARGLTAVTRPIRAECHADRLVLSAAGESGRSRTIVFEKTTEATIDSLVTALWKHIESWGIAGPGMYWRPILVVEVAPDAQTRFAQLERLLHGSGIEIRRKDEE